jgi:hypothetical protein
LRRASDRDDLELSILGHRVLVFLPEESLLNQDVDARREVTGAHLALVVVDRPRVLLAPENELGFLLALRLVTPDGHRHGHQQHHHADADQQRRHRISALAVLTP